MNYLCYFVNIFENLITKNIANYIKLPKLQIYIYSNLWLSNWFLLIFCIVNSIIMTWEAYILLFIYIFNVTRYYLATNLSSTYR